MQKYLKMRKLLRKYKWGRFFYNILYLLRQRGGHAGLGLGGRHAGVMIRHACSLLLLLLVTGYISIETMAK